MWGFLGAAIGAIGSAISTNKTNKSNAALSRWATEFDAKQTAKASNKAYRRNDPARIRKRLERAGYHPGLFAQTAGALTSTEQGSTASFVPLQDNSSAWQTLGQGIGGIAEMELAQERLDLGWSELELQREMMNQRAAAINISRPSIGLYGRRAPAIGDQTLAAVEKYGVPEFTTPSTGGRKKLNQHDYVDSAGPTDSPYWQTPQQQERPTRDIYNTWATAVDETGLHYTIPNPDLEMGLEEFLGFSLIHGAASTGERTRRIFSPVNYARSMEKNPDGFGWILPDAYGLNSPSN